MNESNGAISTFPFKYNAVQGRFTKLELSCLGTAFGFPPDLFDYADTKCSDVIFNPGNDGNDDADATRWATVTKIQAILVPGGPLNEKMNRTANTMDGAYNAKAVNAGIGLINQRHLTFADCRAGSIAFNLYQGGHAGIPLDDFISDKATPAVIFERRELNKAFKLAGRAGAPKFVSKTIKLITNSRRLPERLHYHDFLVLLSRLPSLGQMRGDFDEPDNYITDELYELCDFEDLILTGDQRRGRRLTQSYELQLSRTPSPRKLGDGSDARRHPAAAAAASNPPDGKQRWDMGRHANADSAMHDSSAQRCGPRVDSGRPDDGLVASVQKSISIRRQSLGNNDDRLLKRPGTARTLRKTRSSISLPSATPTEAWHAKGRKTGVRFDKGTKESDVTFDTYWEESQKKLSESWVLKMPRWQDHLLHSLVIPKGNARDRRMSSAQALEQFFRYQGRPPSERLVTSDQVIEAETTTEDLRWRIETKNYRKPIKAVVQPSTTDWGALHPSAKLSHKPSAWGEGGNHAVDENNQGETLTSLFLKKDSQFGTGPQFHPKGTSDFGSDDEYTNSQGSIGIVSDLSGDEGGDDDRRRSSISSNSGVHNSLAAKIKKKGNHLRLVMNANGRPEMVPVDGGTGRPGSGGGGRTGGGSCPGNGNVNAETGSLKRGSGMPKKARIRTEIKPKKKTEVPKLLQRNWKVVGDWS